MISTCLDFAGRVLSPSLEGSETLQWLMISCRLEQLLRSWPRQESQVGLASSAVRACGDLLLGEISPGTFR